ncbi:MAG: AAA family ATPase [Sandaracinus sp.]|nr:AAA family ATPase [Sandaracinus sp.]MCB9616433.1 AAA family ATPase [Sandaracinus sp.]MCB9631945.1 AAA family ATPase [Sandaracinus sp.]
MQIRSLTLENIRLLGDQTFSFEGPDGTIRNWTVLLGENGVCKTSILQAIAIAGSGDRMARKLVDDAADFVDASRTDRDARITAHFDHPQRGAMPATLRVEAGSHAFIGDDAANAFNPIRDKRDPGFLIVGYGIGRRLPKPGEVAIASDPVFDRVEGLFDSHHKMLGVDFFEALRQKGEDLGLRYAETLGRVLLTIDEQGNRLLPWLASFERRGNAGIDGMRKLLESRRLVLDVGRAEPLKLPPHLLSQGYQSTFAWVADLLGHAFLDAGHAVEPAEMTGIVLLDEVDLHLHPRWQRALVPLLRKIFPRMQFVVTTHSPLVLTGFEAHEIIRLDMVDGTVVQTTFEQEPGMQTGTELMAAYFGVPTAARPELEADQERQLELLAQDGRSDVEEAELEAIEKKLQPYLASTELWDLPSPDDLVVDDSDETGEDEDDEPAVLTEEKGS